MFLSGKLANIFYDLIRYYAILIHWRYKFDTPGIYDNLRGEISYMLDGKMVLFGEMTIGVLERMIHMNTKNKFTSYNKGKIKKKSKSKIFLQLLKLCAILVLVLFSIQVLANTIGDRMKKVPIKEEEILQKHDSPGALRDRIMIKEQSYTDLSPGDSEDWMLRLVNGENPLPNNYLPKLKKLKNGLQFDERAIDHLKAMLDDAKAQGLSPVVCSAYRSIDRQKTLYNNKVFKCLADGFDQKEAEGEAKKHVAYPGTSEHNLGLAVDIVSLNYQILDEQQAMTPEIKWLIKNCAKYGFILRYPEDKIDVTGITYEPWHFRFVGIEAAQEIMNNGITLEEYLTNR